MICHEIDSRFAEKEILTRCVSEGFRRSSVVSRLRNEAVTKLETRRVSEDCTKSSSTSLTRRVAILAFGSAHLKKSQPQRVVKTGIYFVTIPKIAPSASSGLGRRAKKRWNDRVPSLNSCLTFVPSRGFWPLKSCLET